MKRLIVLIIIMAISVSACTPTDQLEPSESAPMQTTTPAAPTLTEISAMPTFTPLPLTPTLVPETAFFEGITIGYSGNGPRLGTAGAEEIIRQYIVPSGANYVILVPACWSVNIRDTTIVCSAERGLGGVPPISDEELAKTIQYLHSVGLRVALKPEALVETVIITNKELKERHFNEDQWKAWFESYTAFITHYAQLAEENQADLFVVGNEQEDNTHREQDWRGVIAAVREVYHGPITYAANAFQFEASRIKFWDALDYIGTNGYRFGHVTKQDPTVDEMIEAWQPYLQRLEEMSNEYGKQVLITEIGALSREDWNTGAIGEGESVPYDGQEQADAYTAFFEALKGKDWIKGIFVWAIDTEPLQGGPNEIGYTFIGKPAEQVVYQYFGGQPVASVAQEEFVEDPENSRIVYADELGHGWRPWFEPDAAVIADLASPNGHESAFSIRLPLGQYKGIGFIYDLPFLRMAGYKWLEFDIKVGERPPKNLLVQFEYWTPEEFYHSRLALVNDPNYIEGSVYQPGAWQHVRIPLIDLGITDEIFNGFGINNCVHPCRIDRSVDEIYIDNITLVAGQPVSADTTATATPELAEDPLNEFVVYDDGLKDYWWQWTDEGDMALSDLGFSSGHDSETSIRLPLSENGALTLVYDADTLDLSSFEWLEFYVMAGEVQPKNLIVRLEDWSDGAPTFRGALVDDPNYIESGHYQPGTWQRVRIPLGDLGIHDHRIRNTAAFSLRNCPQAQCGPDSIADDVYIDDIRLIGAKSP